MITTFFGQDGLGSSAAFVLSLLLGFGFGFALEQAGFGSSRRLAGIFYFRDMTVLRVMFTAMVTAMLGLQLALALGVVSAEQIYFLPTIYGAQIVGGLLFGVGFVLSSWCPGTAAVGLASGRLDALIFLGGAALGSILFNEFYGIVGPLATWGDSGVKFMWAALGVSGPVFALLFSAVAVAAFWGSEWIEKKVAGAGPYLGSPFLKAFSVTILVGALAVALLPPATPSTTATAPAALSETGMLQAMEAGDDHIDPDELADRLMAGDASLLLVDIRTPAEFAAFHIRGAVNVAAADLPEFLGPHKNKGNDCALLQRDDPPGPGPGCPGQDGIRERLSADGRPARLHAAGVETGFPAQHAALRSPSGQGQRVADVLPEWTANSCRQDHECAERHPAPG